MQIKWSDRSIISFLLLALGLQVTALLWHMEILTLGALTQEKQNQTTVAAYVTGLQNRLKRRTVGSLVWEKSHKDQGLNFYDSILTLNESTAELTFENGTSLRMSENTLITLEPPVAANQKEITIRFAQGNIKARNPHAAARIEDSETKITLQQNSDIEIFKTDTQNFEIQVNKGEATLERNGKLLKVRDQEILDVSKDGIETVKLSDKIQWVTKPEPRIYSREQDVELKFSWQGIASKLLVRGDVEKEISINAKQNNLSYSLPIGSYRFSLSNKNQRTPVVPVEIWEAPHLHLVSPLPRDRIPFGQQKFIWTPHSTYQNYQLKLKGRRDYPLASVKENTQVVELNSDDDLKWEVWGFDKDGFKIPPPYEYPLHIRENPFAPPKLKTPQEIKPEQRPSASFWLNLLIPQAYAQTNGKALFQWEPIPGANLYFIEISESEDFRNPIVQESTNKTQYIWNFDTEKKYYWRVAAGTRQGRMGQFTAPTLVVVEQAPAVAPIRPIKKVAKHSKSINTKSIKSKPKKPKQEIVKPVPKTENVKEDTDWKGSRLAESRVWWQPNFGTQNHKLEATTTADFSGIGALGMGAELIWNWSKTRLVHTIFSFRSTEFAPDPEPLFPFQENISTLQAQTSVYWQHRKSNWAWGFTLCTTPFVERLATERVGSVNQLSVGPAASYRLSFGAIEYLAQLQLSGGQTILAGSQHRLTTLIFESLDIGIEAEVIYGFGSDQESTLTNASLILGWKF